MFIKTSALLFALACASGAEVDTTKDLYSRVAPHARRLHDTSNKIADKLLEGIKSRKINPNRRHLENSHLLDAFDDHVQHVEEEVEPLMVSDKKILSVMDYAIGQEKAALPQLRGQHRKLNISGFSPPQLGGAGETSVAPAAGETIGAVYAASLFHLSDEGCSGFSPQAEIECLNGGQIELADAVSLTDFEPSCSLTSTSTARCSFGSSHASATFSQGTPVGLIVGYSCTGTSPNSLLSEARFLPDSVQCPAPEFIASFVDIQFYDTTTEATDESFGCPRGQFLDTEDGGFCAGVGTCRGTNCALPATSARQDDPLPSRAIIVAPPEESSPGVTTQPDPAIASGSTDVVSAAYAADFVQLSGTGCSGFMPRAEMECLNGGEIEIIRVTSATDVEPTCTKTSTSVAACNFDDTALSTMNFDDDEFPTNFFVAYSCSGFSQASIVSEARLLSDSIRCSSAEIVAGFVAVSYFDFVTETFEESFTCPSGVSIEAGTGSYCAGPGNCFGSGCTIAAASARQTTPLPSSAIFTA